MDDIDVVDAMRLCRQLRLTVHVRGTDAHPIVEFKDRRYGTVVGGIELKKRLKRLDKIQLNGVIYPLMTTEFEK